MRKVALHRAIVEGIVERGHDHGLVKNQIAMSDRPCSRIHCIEEPIPAVDPRVSLQERLDARGVLHHSTLLDPGQWQIRAFAMEALRRIDTDEAASALWPHLEKGGDPQLVIPNRGGVQWAVSLPPGDVGDQAAIARQAARGDQSLEAGRGTRP